MAELISIIDADPELAELLDEPRRPPRPAGRRCPGLRRLPTGPWEVRERDRDRRPPPRLSRHRRSGLPRGRRPRAARAWSCRPRRRAAALELGCRGLPCPGRGRMAGARTDARWPSSITPSCCASTVAAAGPGALRARDTARARARREPGHRPSPAGGRAAAAHPVAPRRTLGAGGPDGLVLPLPLPHQRLADLIGARRPAVTSALGDLSRRGAISRRGDRSWVLHGDPPTSCAITASRRRPRPGWSPSPLSPDGRPGDANGRRHRCRRPRAPPVDAVDQPSRPV